MPDRPAQSIPHRGDPTSDAEHRDAPHTDAAHPVLAVEALCLGGLAASLTQTMIIPIQGLLPQLLNTSAADASWVITITLLLAAVTMPISGRLADILGKQRVLLGSAGSLLVGSVVSALSDSLAPMLVGRALQGLALGFIPVGIALMREILPANLSSKAVAAMSATLGVGGGIGLPLSAWIVDVGDWHILFWISAGVAVVVLVTTAILVPHVHDAVPARLDVPGALGLATGLALFLIGLSQASSWGWSSGRTLGFILAGLAVLVGWGFVELRTSEPLVDLRSTARLPVLLTNLAATGIGMGMMAQAIVVPQLLQVPTTVEYGLGQTVLEVGLWMAPGGLMMLVVAPISSRLIDTLGAKIALMVGALIMASGYVVALVLMAAPWQIMLATIIISTGVAVGYAAMPTLILDESSAHEAGSAVGVNTLMRSLGTTLASALMGTLLASSTRSVGPLTVPTQDAFQLGFIISAIAALVGAIIVAAVPRRGDSPRYRLHGS